MDQTSTPTPGSSPAQSAPSAQVILDGLSSEQRSKWELTGELPDAPADSSSAKPVEQATDARADSSPAATTDAKADSSSEKPPRTDKRAAENRGPQLDSEITELQEKLRIRRALRDELAQLEQPRAQPDGKTADSSPAARKEWDGSDPNDPKPHDSMFEDHNQYLDARDAWNERRWERRQVAQRQASEQEQQFRAQVSATERLRDEATARVQEYAKTDPEFNRKIDPELTEIEPASVRRLNGQKVGPQHVLAEEILNSPHTAPLLLHFSTDAGKADWARLCGMAYGPLMRAFGELVATVSRTGQAPEPKPTREAPPVKDLSTAPQPGKQLGERPVEPIDPSVAALKSRDFLAFEAAENARELAALQAGR